MARITEKQLQSLVDRLNGATNSPLAPYEKDSEGRFKARIGNYHLSYAYGGVCLHRMQNLGGGVEDVFRSGHETKRELYNRICAFLDGIEVGKAGAA